MQPTATTLDNLGLLPQRLEVVDSGDQRPIFWNGYAAARYCCDDKVTERVLITQLAEVVPLPDRQIAAAFQIHPVTLSRFRAMARSGGTAALMPAQPGPKGPSKMTPKREACCRALRQQGLSFRAIAQKISNRRVRISHVTVAGLFQQTSAPPQPETLPLAPDTPSPHTRLSPPAAEPAPQSAAAPEMPELSVPESQHSRYAGSDDLVRRPRATGGVESMGQVGGQCRSQPALRMGSEGRLVGILLRASLPFR